MFFFGAGGEGGRKGRGERDVGERGCGGKGCGGKREGMRDKSIEGQDG